MPRPNAPFYRTQKDSWYGRIHGRVVSLGVRGRGNRKVAMEQFARKLLDRATIETPTSVPSQDLPSTSVPVTAQPSALPSVHFIIEQFLAAAVERMSCGCLRNYRLFLLPLAAEIGLQSADKVDAGQIEAHDNRAI
jgi:hypothetical protein